MAKNRLNQIGSRVRRVRDSIGWSGRELARRAKIPQSTLSRIESGQRIRSAEIVEQVISVLPFNEKESSLLRAEVRATYAAVNERRVDAGFSLKSDMVRRLERSVASVSGFQSAVIPRPLRTAVYAKAAGTRDLGLSGLLDDGKRDFRFVITEGALRTWPGDGSVMLAQLDHLAAVSRRANVWLGVVPWSVPLGVVPPHGFTLYGDEAVSLETFTAEVTITDPDAVAAYRDAFAAVERAAVDGDEARTLLTTIRDDFGELAE